MLTKQKKRSKRQIWKKKVEAASTGKSLDHKKQISRSVTLIMAIQDLGLTNQKLNTLLSKSNHCTRDC
jgi:hypothetical protein